jgi:hypothetical protein
LSNSSTLFCGWMLLNSTFASIASPNCFTTSSYFKSGISTFSGIIFSSYLISSNYFWSSSFLFVIMFSLCFVSHISTLIF